jgi:hypothetical protein
MSRGRLPTNCSKYLLSILNARVIQPLGAHERERQGRWYIKKKSKEVFNVNSRLFLLTSSYVLGACVTFELYLPNSVLEYTHYFNRQQWDLAYHDPRGFRLSR